MARSLSFIAGLALLATALGLGGWLFASPGGTAGEQWSIISTTNPPADRWGQPLVYDQTFNRILMFGGDQGTDNVLSDLWVFPLPTGPWTLLTPTGGPPTARRGHSGVWNAASQEMLIFGGDCGPSCSLNDVWSYDVVADTWTLLANNGTPPPAGYDFQTVWDPNNEKMLVFGGFEEPSTLLNNLYEYDRATQTWTQLSPTGGPPSARSAGAAVWDDVDAQMLVFGGQSSGGPVDDLWAYSPTSNQWTQLSPTGGPPAARSAMGATWDPFVSRLIIFGGRDGATRYDDTWGYNVLTNDWEQLALTGPTPAARAEVPIVWTQCAVDPVFMYGGTVDSNANGPEEQEFWEFSEITCVETPTPTNTLPPTNTPTVTNTPTPTNTLTATFTASPTNTPTNSPTPTNTPTNTPTSTNTATPTNTPVPTDTPTPTPTNTPDATATFNAQGSMTPLATDTPTNTPTATPTNTVSASTATPTNTPTATPTNTIPAFTATPTNTPANTPTPTPTNTVFGTPTSTSSATGVEKVPEGNANNTDPSGPSANLWICEVGPCAGPGEGNLLVIERAFNIQTGDENNDTVEDGLGAYEFSVEYDNFVIQSVNPCDIVFGPGGAGSARGPVDELNTSDNPYCVPDPDAANNGTCAYSIILENLVHFGCVTNGQLPGPTGSFDLAALNLIPHPDLNNDIFPGNNNGVLTVIKDNGCELVDTFGHPILESVNGGLTPACRDLAVTVRILEGDLDLDCDVDLSDAQQMAARYGAFFGGLLYSKWYDLEPELHDLDIDIKDVQKVFGRQDSTCQVPIPEQPPLPPPAPFQD